MSYKLRITAKENFRKAEILFQQGRYEEAVSYLRQSAWDSKVQYQCYALLAYCHYKGLGTPVNHYAAHMWYRHLIARKEGIETAKSMLGSEFDKISSLRVDIPTGNRYEFYDYKIGRIVLRGETGRERVQFYNDRVEVELSKSYLHYDSYQAIEMIYGLYDWHEENRRYPVLIDQSYREDYDHYSLRIERGKGNKFTHRVEGDCYTIIVPRDIRFDQLVTREAIIIESNKLMRKAALKYLPQRLKELSERTGLKYSGCQIKKMSDCAACYYYQTKQIVITPEIITYSSRKIDAILIHELCHSLIKGHGQDFYDLILKHGGEEILRINKTFPEYNLS